MGNFFKKFFSKKKTYYFKVGVRNLLISRNYTRTSKSNHACLLLDNDIFEYGVDTDSNGKRKYSRHKNVDKSFKNQFDWDYLDKKGITQMSPDELEKEIIANGKWESGHYWLLFHNCHDFVQFCLKKMGCSKDMTKKFFPCYTRKN